MNTNCRMPKTNRAQRRLSALTARAGASRGLVASLTLLCTTAGLCAAGCGDDPQGSTFSRSEESPWIDPGAGGNAGNHDGDDPFVVGDAGGGPLPSGCATDSYPGEVVALDMHLMLDRSSSMQHGTPPKWGEITAAISSFMDLPTPGDLGMSMAIFPVARSQPAPISCTASADCLPFSVQCVAGSCVDDDPQDATSCWTSDYASPLVAMGDLPAIAPQITAAMNEIEVMGRTPMAPALLGAIDYATAHADKTADRITTVVLATDGYPTKCATQDIGEVAALAGSAFEHKGLKTFVIGIGDGLENLNLIAQKGGTGEAIMVDSGNAGEEFLAALNLIRGSMHCSYKVPVPASGEADLNQLNVAITAHGGEQEVLPRVGSETECNDEAGYYLDDPSDPDKLTLCPASCQRVRETGADVHVVIGCGALIK